MKLQPLLDNLEDIITRKGRYEVQLEIPKASTLTSGEIEKILELASWKSSPGGEADGFEGNRSVLIKRESPIKKHEIELGCLQISGIGHRNLRMLSDYSIMFDEGFYPPSKENFINSMKGTKMTTSHAEGNKIIDVRPKYRALGTYLQSELKEKIKNTMEVSKLRLEKMVVPYVEAYGRYLDPELKNEDGNFGFIVSPAPSLKNLRAGEEIVQKFLGSSKIEDIGSARLDYSFIAIPYIQKMITALRELHENCRRVHLQTHLDNFYVIDGVPYVVDWATTRKLGSNAEENIINRVIDIQRPAVDFVNIFRTVFNSSEDSESTAEALANESVINTYLKNPIRKTTYESVLRRAYSIIGKEGTTFDAFVQWMKDTGIEKYPMSEIEKRNAKPGRNQPCPCGSGVKYKKCCGKY